MYKKGFYGELFKLQENFKNYLDKISVYLLKNETVQTDHVKTQQLQVSRNERGIRLLLNSQYKNIEIVDIGKINFTHIFLILGELCEPKRLNFSVILRDVFKHGYESNPLPIFSRLKESNIKHIGWNSALCGTLNSCYFPTQLEKPLKRNIWKGYRYQNVRNYTACSEKNKLNPRLEHYRNNKNKYPKLCKAVCRKELMRKKDEKRGWFSWLFKCGCFGGKKASKVANCGCGSKMLKPDKKPGKKDKSPTSSVVKDNKKSDCQKGIKKVPCSKQKKKEKKICSPCGGGKCMERLEKVCKTALKISSNCSEKQGGVPCAKQKESELPDMHCKNLKNKEEQTTPNKPEPCISQKKKKIQSCVCSPQSSKKKKDCEKKSGKESGKKGKICGPGPQSKKETCSEMSSKKKKQEICSNKKDGFGESGHSGKKKHAKDENIALLKNLCASVLQGGKDPKKGLENHRSQPIRQSDSANRPGKDFSRSIYECPKNQDQGSVFPQKIDCKPEDAPKEEQCPTVVHPISNKSDVKENSKTSQAGLNRLFRKTVQQLSNESANFSQNTMVSTELNVQENETDIIGDTKHIRYPQKVTKKYSNVRNRSSINANELFNTDLHAKGKHHETFNDFFSSPEKVDRISNEMAKFHHSKPDNIELLSHKTVEFCNIMLGMVKLFSAYRATTELFRMEDNKENFMKRQRQIKVLEDSVKSLEDNLDNFLGLKHEAKSKRVKDLLSKSNEDLTLQKIESSHLNDLDEDVLSEKEKQFFKTLTDLVAMFSTNEIKKLSDEFKRK